MAHNNVDNMLDNLRRMITNESDLNVVKSGQIEILKMKLQFFRASIIDYHHFLLPNSLVKITMKVQLIREILRSVFGGNTDKCKTKFNVEMLISVTIAGIY